MILLAAIAAAFGSVGFTVFLRVVPPVKGWNERGWKPWACDLCMSFWCTAVCLGVGAAMHRVSTGDAFLAWMPAFAVAYGIVQRIVPPPMGGPPIDPPPG